MTEDEAKTKKCCGPKIILLGLLVSTGKRITDPEAPLLCIGSDCMAWRWSYPPDEAAGNKNGPQGFCGLAGKP